MSGAASFARPLSGLAKGPPRLPSLLADLVAVAPLWQIARAQLAGEGVEHTVDDAWLVTFKECVRHVDVLADDDAWRHVIELNQLEGASAQDGAQDGIDPSEPPSLRQLPVDHWIDLPLAPHDALQHVREVLGVRLAACTGVHTIIGLFAQPMRLELLNHSGQVRLGEVHLIERLHGREAGLASRQTFGIGRAVACRAHSASSKANTRSSAISARQARTASAPLPLRPPRARSSAWVSVSTVRIALPSGIALAIATCINQ